MQRILVKLVTVAATFCMLATSLFCVGVFWTTPTVEPLLRWGSIVTTAASIWLLYNAVEGD
jgi:hypothetical protein